MRWMKWVLRCFIALNKHNILNNKLQLNPFSFLPQKKNLLYNKSLFKKRNEFSQARNKFWFWCFLMLQWLSISFTFTRWDLHFTSREVYKCFSWFVFIFFFSFYISFSKRSMRKKSRIKQKNEKFTTRYWDGGKRVNRMASRFTRQNKMSIILLIASHDWFSIFFFFFKPFFFASQVNHVKEKRKMKNKRMFNISFYQSIRRQ